MAILFGFLAKISILLFIIGLIKPSWVIRWGKEEDKSRKEVLKYYLGTWMFFGIMNSLFIEMDFDNSNIFSYILVSIFFIVHILSFIALLLGLIKPSWAIRWGREEDKNRKTLIKYYVPTFLISIFTVAILEVAESKTLISLIISIIVLYVVQRKTYKKNRKKEYNFKTTSPDVRWIYKEKNSNYEKKLDKIFEKKEINNKLVQFILEYTREFENSGISKIKYDEKLNLFRDYINTRQNFYDLTSRDLKEYIEKKKIEVYIEDMDDKLKIQDEKDLGEKIKKYIEVLGKEGLENLNIHIFSQLIDEEYISLSTQIKEEYRRIEGLENQKILKLIFKDGENKNKLDKFIINNTKKYDTNEIDNQTYYDSLAIFSEKLNEDIKDSLDIEKSFDLDPRDLREYIEKKKIEVYIEDMDDKLKIQDEKDLDEKIKKYIGVLGKEGLENLNIHIFSQLIDEEYISLSTQIKEEYKRIEELRIQKILKLIFEDGENKNKLDKFIINNTKKYDTNEIDNQIYYDSIAMFSEKLNEDIKDSLDIEKSFDLNPRDLREYIEKKKIEVYIEDMDDKIKIQDEKDLDEKIKKYIGVLGEEGLENLNIHIFSQLIDEDYIPLSTQIKEEYKRIKRNEDLYNLIFGYSDLKSKLEKFILNNTKKYDGNEIDKIEYENNLNLFLEYIIKRIEREITDGRYPIEEKLSEYIAEQNYLKEKLTDLKLYIENKKQRTYTSEMKSILKIKDEDKLEDKIEKYVAIYGESGLETFNLRVFSILLNMDALELAAKVKKEYERERREYELRRMEETLFGSSINKRDLKYIDSLSGFQFEDYLEDLFIEFGYRTKDLPYSNDYGADLIITKGLEDIVIQAKKYNSNNVGVQAVQEVIAAKSHYKTDIAMVITNSYYTANAIEAARISDVIMIDRDDLDRILKEGRSYFNSFIN